MITFSQLGSYGRLGNSLFQISATIALAARNNDIAGFPEWKYNSFFKKPLNKALVQPYTVYTEPHFHYSQIPYQPNLDIQGYFQSEKYFSDFSSLIKEQFEFNKNADSNIKEEDCSIHVRRGDYLQKQEYHPVQPMEYYNHAIEIMKSKGCETFLVFSDDVKWCKDNFKGEHFRFAEGNNEIQDLNIMSKCSNHIIANSSFSWFGSWLCSNTDKNVIAPKKWFGSSYQINTKDLYCKDWMIL